MSRSKVKGESISPAKKNICSTWPTLQGSANPATEQKLVSWMANDQRWDRWIVISTRPIQQTQLQHLQSNSKLVWIDLSSP